MAEHSDTESTYSPSSWGRQESVWEDHNSLFDSQRISTPVPPTPIEVLSEHENVVSTTEKRPKKRPRRTRDQLPLLYEGEWEPNRLYNEEPPICVHYSIEWIVTLNGKSKSKDTKRNLVLEPAAYWRLFLHPCLGKLVQQKFGHIQDVRAVETSVIVSTTARGEPDLTLRFDGLDIGCSDINSQLTEWSGLYKEGKRLQVEFTFHYETPDEPLTGTRLKMMTSKEVGNEGVPPLCPSHRLLLPGTCVAPAARFLYLRMRHCW